MLVITYFRDQRVDLQEERQRLADTAYWDAERQRVDAKDKTDQQHQERRP